MRTSLLLATAVALISSFSAPATAAGEQAPDWAYPIAPKDYVLPADDGSIRHVPGSSAGWTLTEVRDLFAVHDWFPDAHPPLPTIVAVGRKPDRLACGVCHRSDGVGGPENASLAGLPVEYMLRQIADYRSGARSTGVAQRLHVFRMIGSLKQASDDDLAAAVAYFSARTLPPRIRVKESTTVPTTYVPNWYFASKEDGATEPLGRRIIEMPDDEQRFVSRDSRVTFTAWVPPGSLARGEALVAGQEGDRIPACAGCHGEGLKGQADIPPLAGRSPSYVVRQLWEFREGKRNGTMAEAMKGNVAQMTLADMIAIAAYTASLTP